MPMQAFSKSEERELRGESSTDFLEMGKRGTLFDDTDPDLRISKGTSGNDTLKVRAIYLSAPF